MKRKIYWLLISILFAMTVGFFSLSFDIRDGIILGLKKSPIYHSNVDYSVLCIAIVFAIFSGIILVKALVNISDPKFLKNNKKLEDT